MSSVEEVTELASSACKAQLWHEVIRIYQEAGDDAKESSAMREMFALASYALGRYSEVLGIQGYDQGDLKWIISQDLHDNDLAKKHRLVWRGPALAEVAYTTMIKDEEDIVFVNLAWHYSLGFRKFVLVDNASADQTRAEIERFAGAFKDAVVIVIDDPILGYFQAEFMTAAFRVACSVWPEVKWVFLIDGDEFLCLERGLGDILAEVPESVVALHVPKSQYKATEEFNSLDSSLPFYLRLTRRERISHVSTKIVVRSYPFLEISQGNHWANFRGEIVKACAGGLSLGLHYREFILRSLEHTKKKVVNGGKAIAAAEALGKDPGGPHWKAWYEIYLRDGEPAIKAIFESHFRDAADLIEDPLPLAAALGQLAVPPSSDG
jgi:hypothetical protein